MSITRYFYYQESSDVLWVKKPLYQSLFENIAINILKPFIRLIKNKFVFYIFVELYYERYERFNYFKN